MKFNKTHKVPSIKKPPMPETNYKVHSYRIDPEWLKKKYGKVNI